jgi:hypothetical protein
MRERARAMLDRVTSEAAAVLAPDDTALVRASLERCLDFRDDRIDDDHDPRLLHPARTIRILIADAACRDADALAAAPWVDSIDAELVPSFDGVPADAGARAIDVAASIRDVPLPGDDDGDLLERLVCAPPVAALIALAERLDQVRHVHLRPGLSSQSHLDQVRAVYAPAARRIAPALGRRFDRWADALERRLLLRRAAGLP